MVFGSPGSLAEEFDADNRLPLRLLGFAVTSGLVLVLGLLVGSESQSSPSDPDVRVLTATLLTLAIVGAVFAVVVFQASVTALPRVLIGDSRRFLNAVLAVVSANAVLAVRNFLLGLLAATSVVSTSRVVGFLSSPAEPFGWYALVVFFAVYKTPTSSFWLGVTVRVLGTTLFALLAIGPTIALQQYLVGSP